MDRGFPHLGRINTQTQPIRLGSVDTRRLRSSTARLCGEFDALLEQVPSGLRTSRGLGQHLGVNRNLCQRLYSALSIGTDELEKARRLPGTDGMALLLRGFERRRYSVQHVKSVRTALEEFQKVVREIAGSRAKLLRIIGEENAGPDDAESEDAGISERETLFRGAVSVVGRSSDIQLVVVIDSPSSVDPEHNIDTVMMHGHLGHRAEARAVPLVRHFGFTSNEERPGPKLQSTGAGGKVTALTRLVESFSSSDLPRRTIRPSRANRLLEVFDEAADPSVPLDVFSAVELLDAANPLQQPGDANSQIVRTQYPARRLVIDMYRHRLLSSQCTPSAGVYTWDPNMGLEPSLRWHERLLTPVHVQVLPTDSGRSTLDGWDRYSDLATQLFALRPDVAGARNRDEYVHYRVDQAFPVWNAFYYVTLECPYAP